MAETLPRAGGFAAALETYLSRGGNTYSRGRKGTVFTQGPIRGMTVEQATQQARDLWANASPAVREKYAGKDASLLTPGERQRQIPALEQPVSAGRQFSDGTRRPTPGDSNGDGMIDARQPVPAAGGKPLQATPEEAARARQVAEEASATAGQSAMNVDEARGTIAGMGGARSTDIGIASAGIVATSGARTTESEDAWPPPMHRKGEHPRTYRPDEIMRFTDPLSQENWDKTMEWRRDGRFVEALPPGHGRPITPGPNGDYPSRSSLLASGQPFSKASAMAPPKINKATGREFGYVPPEGAGPAPIARSTPPVHAGPGAGGVVPKRPASAVPGIERPVQTSYQPGVGMVPKSQEVAEAPMDYAGYDAVRQSVDPNDVNSLDPASPEARAARGRMRTFEDEQRSSSAMAARLERTGATDRAKQEQARRNRDRNIASSYGRIAGLEYSPVAGR